MKILISFFALTLCFAFGRLMGQELEDYQPIRSQGEIPEEFRTLSADKFEEQASEIGQEDNRKTRKSKEKFLLSSNYFIDQMLLSGKVLFNDPVGEYVNEVADLVLKDDPELRDKISIFMIKSPIVNAITTNNGIIFVTMGLIAQLENEAQLAYILSHEFVHFRNDHVMDSYLEQEKIGKGKGAYRQTSLEEKVLATFNYSKDLEFEADEEGLELYLNTNYSLEEIDGVFDVLQYSYLPFDEVEFEKSYFESSDLIFPEDYFLEEVNEIAMDDDYDDTKSTHPNIRRRRKKLDKITRDESNEGRVEYTLPESKFAKVQTIARFELSRLYLINRDYAKSIYNSFLLLKIHPENKYLRTTIARSLYGLSKYKNDGSFRRVHERSKNIEGNIHQLYYFINELEGDEINALAVRYAWLLREDYPKDKHIRELTNDILRELVVEHNVEVSDYFKKPREVLVEEMEIVEDEDMSELSKYEKIKRKKAVDNVQGDENFIGYAFVELFKTDDFEDTFEDIMDEIEDELRESEKKLNKADAKKKRKAEEKLARIEKNRGKALGIDKIVIVDPYYIKVDERKADAIQYGDTEAKMLEYSEKLKMNAAMLDLNIEILDSKDFQIDDADKFNDFSLLNDWVGESLDHEDDLDEERNMIISDKAYVNKLIKKYDTKYFMWTGVISVHERKSLSYYYACVALMGIITIPFTIYYLVIPEYSTYLYTVVYNIETGEKVLIERDLIRKKDRKDILNSRIYDTLFQIKSKRENIK